MLFVVSGKSPKLNNDDDGKQETKQQRWFMMMKQSTMAYAAISCGLDASSRTMIYSCCCELDQKQSTYNNKSKMASVVLSICTIFILTTHNPNDSVVHIAAAVSIKR